MTFISKFPELSRPSRTSNESGRLQIYVQSFPPTGSKWQISTDGGSQPQWRADGKELFYLSPTANDQFMAVDITSGPSDVVFKAGVPKKLFVINVLTVSVPGGQRNQRNSYDVMKDGQRFLLNASPDATPNVGSSITVVLNWAAGLEEVARLIL